MNDMVWLAGLMLLTVYGAQGAEGQYADTRYRLQLATPGDYKLRIATEANPDLPFDKLVREAAARQNLDPALVHAVIAVESGHRPNAHSSAGAAGLMQLMPGTAKRFGVEQAHTPSRNVEAGSAYLRWLLNRFDQNLELALAAYNAGEGAVNAHHRQIPPYAETRRYVPAVTERYREYKRRGNPYRLQATALAPGYQSEME